MKDKGKKYEKTCAILTFVGLRSRQLHATTQRLVLPPACSVVTAQFLHSISFNLDVMARALLSLPNMLVYHCPRLPSDRLSSIIRSTNPTSPPSVIISTSAPEHGADGDSPLLHVLCISSF